MSASTDLLSVTAFATLLVTLALWAFGRRQTRYDGWRFWVGALGLASAGSVAAALPASAWAGPLAAGLLGAWPVVALQGLRRFHPRQSLPGGARWDLTVLVVGVALAAAAAGWTAWVPSARADAGVPAPLPPWGSAGAALVMLYAAAVVLHAPGGREFSPVRGLGGAWLLGAVVPGLAPLWPGHEHLPVLLRAVATMAGAVVLAFVALTLVCERTERQLRDSRRRLRALANLDTLTQVPNRRHFQELADHALGQDEPGTAVLLIFDIDHFKRINDLFGHAAGDRALRLVTSSMLEHLRAQDVPGRQGGDEFVLLLRRTTPRDALGVAGRIVAEVQRRAPLHQLPTLSLSFGVVRIGVGESVTAALRRADQAMYEAKRQGRSRAVAAEGHEDSLVFSESRPLGLTPA